MPTKERRSTPHHDPSPEALFRWTLVSQVLAGESDQQSRRRKVRELAGEPHLELSGKVRQVSMRTLERWLRSYQDEGLSGLEPIPRAKRDSSVLSPALLAFAREQKEQDPAVSIPEILRRAHEKGVVGDTETIARSTLYRAMRQLGIHVRRCRSPKENDSRRFAHAHRMQCVLADGKHFRAGPKRVKRVVLTFLDDATRKVLHAVVGPSESTPLFLRGLYEMICRHGIPDTLYLDRGPGFISRDTAAVLAKLGIRLILGKVRYPEGHGKIERYHRTLRDDLLRHLSRRRDLPTSCTALELRLQHYSQKVYNLREHSSLGGMSPEERFLGDSRKLEFPEDRSWLRGCFLLYRTRRVSQDHVVNIGSTPLETPKGYAGQKVMLRHHLLDGIVHLLHQGRLIELQPVDLQRNARTRRGKGPQSEAETAASLPPSSAELAFARDFGPAFESEGEEK